MTTLFSTKTHEFRVKELALLSKEELLSYISEEVKKAYIHGYNRNNLTTDKFPGHNFNDMSMGNEKVLLDCYLKDTGYEL